MELNTFQTILNTIANAMETPIMIILIVMLAFAVFCIGWVLAEALGERRHMNYSMPKLLDQLKAGPEDLQEQIKKSGLLYRQKDALLELTAHPDLSRKMLAGLEENLLEKEQSHYEAVLNVTGLLSKLAPMAGLLGTLVPLGPGIIALGQGDTMTLSASMLTAFDTTIAGLLVAAVCLIIHTLRKRWYNRYMSDLETLADCVVEMETSEA